MIRYKKCIWLMAFVVVHMSQSKTLNAQDTMYKRDGSKVAVKVLIVNDQDIVYVPFEQVNSKYQFRILRNAVQYIKYENNWIDTFTLESFKKTPEPKVDLLAENFGLNRLSFYLSDPIAGILSFQYERLHKNGFFSIAVPISSSMEVLGLQSSNRSYLPTTLDYYNQAKYFNTGLQLNYYPFGQGTFAYWTGAFSEYGFNKDIQFYTLLLQNGLMYHPHKHLHTAFSFSYGAIHSRLNSITNLKSSTFRISLLLGYTF